MLKKFKVIIMGLVLVSGILFAVAPALTAGETGPDLGLSFGKATNLGTQDVRYTVAMIINASLGLLGIISVTIIVYAGFRWMTSGGNEEDIKSAQKTLLAAVMGLVIILSAYAITKFVTTQLFKATTGFDYEQTVGSDNP